MRIEPEDIHQLNVFLAGDRVEAGRYRELNSGKELHLETEDTLPASLDGRVACYARLTNIWAELIKEHLN